MGANLSIKDCFFFLNSVILFPLTFSEIIFSNCVANLINVFFQGMTCLYPFGMFLYKYEYIFIRIFIHSVSSLILLNVIILIKSSPEMHVNAEVIVCNEHEILYIKF